MMNDLQKKQLELLKEFDRVCQENNLTYYANGGTCIGAIRHKGFIPWDDDIDVMMPRPDYEKLLKLQNPWSDKKYFFQTFRTDKHYLLNFAKLRDSSTTFIESYFKNVRQNHGVWIDIFPMDGISKKDKVYKKKKRYKCIRTWVNVYLSYPYGLRRKIHKRTFFKDIGLNIVAYLFFWTNLFQYRNKMINHWMKRIPYEEAVYVTNYCGNFPSKAYVRKEWLGKPVRVPFEDTYINVPERYDDYLTFIFGDYMTPPPPEKCIGHHYHRGFDLNMGYEEYLKKHKI